MEKDPVCGTYVDVASSLHDTFGGQIKYFCSSQCLSKYHETFYHERNTKSV
jgi:YHS domain-containing protein